VCWQEKEQKDIPDEQEDGSTLGDGGGFVSLLALNVKAENLCLAAVGGWGLFDSHLNVVVLGRL